MAVITLVFHWSDEHGPCYDCGNPAAFRIADASDIRVCALCAANHAADGDEIARLGDEPHDDDNAPAVVITRGQLREWTGRQLSPDEIERLDNAVPFSSIPEALATIAENIGEED